MWSYLGNVIHLALAHRAMDGGFVALRWLYTLGVAKPTEAGPAILEGAELTEVGL